MIDPVVVSAAAGVLGALVGGATAGLGPIWAGSLARKNQNRAQLLEAGTELLRAAFNAIEFAITLKVSPGSAYVQEDRQLQRLLNDAHATFTVRAPSSLREKAGKFVEKTADTYLLYGKLSLQRQKNELETPETESLQTEWKAARNAFIKALQRECRIG